MDIEQLLGTNIFVFLNIYDRYYLWMCITINLI